MCAYVYIHKAITLPFVILNIKLIFSIVFMATIKRQQIVTKFNDLKQWYLSHL